MMIKSFWFVLLSIIIALFGVLLWQDQRYNLIIILLVVVGCLPFYLKYEHSHPKAREVVVLAIMISLAVMSRWLFILTPSIKPVSAIVIITGMIFGRQNGFLTGSLAALISDLLFGIGPWTPFQMLSWGLIGYFAGVFKTALKKPLWLYVYALFSGMVFSMVMDLWSVLALENTFNLSRYLLTVAYALPVTIIYMVSNVIFIFLFKQPLVKIMTRVKLKYGIMEGIE